MTRKHDWREVDSNKIEENKGYKSSGERDENKNVTNDDIVDLDDYLKLLDWYIYLIFYFIN